MLSSVSHATSMGDTNNRRFGPFKNWYFRFSKSKMCTPCCPGSATSSRPVLSCAVENGRTISGLPSGGPAMMLNSLVKKLRGLVNSRTDGVVRRYSTVAREGVTAPAGNRHAAARRKHRIVVCRILTGVLPPSQYGYRTVCESYQDRIKSSD